jgi:hypothetical protein
MNSQVDFVERREHPRVGVMAQLQDITYSVLRKHGIASAPGCETPAPKLTARWLELEGHDNDKLTVIVSNDQPGREERTWRCGRAHAQQRKRQFRYDEETTRSNDFAHIALTAK